MQCNVLLFINSASDSLSAQGIGWAWLGGMAGQVCALARVRPVVLSDCLRVVALGAEGAIGGGLQEGVWLTNLPCLHVP